MSQAEAKQPTGKDLAGARRASWWLWAIVALGAVLRLIALGHKSFWLDEIASVVITRLPDSGILVDAVARRRQHGAVLRSAAPLAVLWSWRSQRPRALGGDWRRFDSAGVRARQTPVRRDDGSHSHRILRAQCLCHLGLTGGPGVQFARARGCGLDVFICSPHRATHNRTGLRLRSRSRSDPVLPLLRDVRSRCAPDFAGSFAGGAPAMEAVGGRRIVHRTRGSPRSCG